MNKCFIGFIFFVGWSCAVITHAQDQQQNLFEILKKTQHWGLVRADTACIEQYNFKPLGEVAISSQKERVTGNYSFLENTQKFELPAVTIHFTTDNKQPDCAGDSTDQTGTTTTNFLKKYSDKKIYFCNDSLGKDCPVYLKPNNNLK